MITNMRKFTSQRLLEMLHEISAKEAMNWSERRSYLVTDNSIVKSSERDRVVTFLLEVSEKFQFN